jgi:hypothetical protein
MLTCSRIDACRGVLTVIGLAMVVACTPAETQAIFDGVFDNAASHHAYNLPSVYNPTSAEGQDQEQNGSSDNLRMDLMPNQPIFPGGATLRPYGP